MKPKILIAACVITSALSIFAAFPIISSPGTTPRLFTPILFSPGIAMAQDGASSFVKAGYNPNISYEGIFEARRLYKKSTSAGDWKGNRKPAFIKDVTCAEAKEQLEQQGFWQGHLNKDGGCGPSAEPLEWAVGNRLNFESE